MLFAPVPAFNALDIKRPLITQQAVPLALVTAMYPGMNEQKGPLWSLPRTGKS